MPYVNLHALLFIASASSLYTQHTGSGIFASPGSVLVHTKSAGLALVAWVLAGVLALLGCATYAELGTMIPEAGGEYAYLNRAFGQWAAFLFTWTNTLMVRPVGLAISATVCGQYASKPFYLTTTPPQWISQGIGLGVLVFVCIMNSVSVAGSTFIQRWTVYGKLLALAVVAVVGFVYLIRAGPGSIADQNLSHAFNGSDWSITDFGVGMSASLLSYDGWNNLNIVIEEIMNPRRNIPLAMGLSLIHI